MHFQAKPNDAVAQLVEFVPLYFSVLVVHRIGDWKGLATERMDSPQGHKGGRIRAQILLLGSAFVSSCLCGKNSGIDLGVLPDDRIVAPRSILQEATEETEGEC
jgi:hypothetical protein